MGIVPKDIQAVYNVDISIDIPCREGYICD